MSPGLLSALGVALAGGTRLDMPVPLEPHPSDTNVCAVVDGADLDLPSTTMDDGRWEVSCSARDGRYRVCLKVLATHVPRRPVPLRCEGERTWLEVRPVVAYDRDDDPRDGVSVIRGTREAMFFVTDLPAATGVMEPGACAVMVTGLPGGGQLTTFVVRPVRRLRRDRTCTLTFADSSTLDVPVRAVRDASALRAAQEPPDPGR